MLFQNLARHQDIGANSYLIEAGSTRLVLDAGTHPKHTGRSTLPRFEELTNSEVDAVIISHPHLDHIGALPCIARENPYAALITTEQTREYGEALLHNSVNVMKAQRSELSVPEYPLFSHREVDATIRSIETRELRAPFALGDEDRVTCEFHHAGHTLGATGVMLEYGGQRLFYTGDVHFEDQTVTRGADFPTENIDTLVIETTRGEHPRDPGYTRQSEKERLGEAILKTIERGGTVLIPVFALGKTQEVLLMLHELREDGLIPTVPVHIGGLSTRMTTIADRFSEYSGRCRPGYQFLEDFEMLEVLPRGRREPIFKRGEIYALSSGMMSEHTVSNRFARRILSNRNHGLFFVGYADSATPGGVIQAAGQGGEVSLDGPGGPTQSIRCQVDQFDFSGHSPRDQIVDYIEAVSPKRVLLVHGDAPAKMWFETELAKKLTTTEVIVPRPGEQIMLD
ncbi:MAG: MBL fold metallo-hydrolase [Verrucomicrobiota bacterium]